MKNKSYDYIFGNGKFNTWFNIIVSIISCSAISFCLTELLFSFDFKVSFQKALIFTILFVFFLLLFYYFIKQRTYKLFDQKITYGFRERKILYADIHSLVFVSTFPVVSKHHALLSDISLFPARMNGMPDCMLYSAGARPTFFCDGWI